MIDDNNFRALLLHLGFVQDHGEVSAIWRKSFVDGDYGLEVDFGQKQIVYPKNKGFTQFLLNNCLYCANVCDKLKAAGKSTSCRRTAGRPACSAASLA